MSSIKKILLHPLFFIFMAGFLLRIYQLQDFPVGFHVDEVKIGWNAISIWETGKDDFGKPYPLHYNSFGDFRPTGYIYLTIPSILLFGANEFAVRFPSALIGSLTITVLYFFVRSFYAGNNSKQIATASALLIALSPWHISLSRATSEGLVSLILTLTGLLLLINYLKSAAKVSLSQKHYLILGVSFVLLFLSTLFYHVPRVLNPVLVSIIIFYFWFFREKSRRFSPVIAVFLLLIFGITILFSINNEARGRFNQVSVFNDLNVRRDLDLYPFEEGHNSVFTARLFHNKLVLWGTNALNEYGQYFSSKFFITPFEAKPTRYSSVGMGVLSYVELVLVLLGLVAIIRGKFSFLPFLLLLAAPLPASLTTEDSPNLMRSLYMIPFFAILGGFGLIYLKELFPKFKFVIPFTLVLLSLNFIYYLHMYYIHNHQRPPISNSRSVGAKELAIALGNLHGKYAQVKVTNMPDDLHPWYGFFNLLDPADYNPQAYDRVDREWRYQNITFSKQRCPSRDAYKKNNDNILVVDAEGCESEAKYPKAIQVLDRISRPDHAYPYIIWHRVEKEVFPPDEATSGAKVSQ